MSLIEVHSVEMVNCPKVDSQIPIDLCRECRFYKGRRDERNESGKWITKVHCLYFSDKL